MPGTRVEALNEIVVWFSDDSPQASRAFWLNGIPGLGKSTIAKTIAQKARDAGRLGATFFFSRRAADIRLRDPAAVIPTLAYQLALSSEGHKAAVIAALERHPDIAELDLAEQAQHLLQDAILLAETHGLVPLIVVDAFDECDGPNTSTLLRILLSTVLGSQGVPLKLLITSRPEHHIQRVFHAFTTSNRLVLHDIEKNVVEGDIKLYLERSLAKLAEELDYPNQPPWFSLEQLARLVESSGKLFVYAATAVRFIASDPLANPPSRLKKVLAQSSHSVNVFSSLDGLYLEILENVADVGEEELEGFRMLLASIILLRDFLSVSALAKLISIAPPTARRALGTISSLVIYPLDDSQNITIYHPSFAEFLMERTRCTNDVLYIERQSHEKELAIRCLGIIKSASKSPVQPTSNAIASELRYSCTYWAAHLSNSPEGDPQLIKLLVYFTHHNFLRWLEVMSVVKLVPTAVKVLRDAEAWAVSNEQFSRIPS